MMLKRDTWEQGIELILEKPKSIIIRDQNIFFNYQKELLKQSNGEEGKFNVYGSEKPLSFESEIEVIPNIFTIQLNSRKITTNLYKKLTKEVTLSDSLFEFEGIKSKLIDFLINLRMKTLIDFTFSEDEFETEDVFKLFDLKYNDNKYKPAELLCKYIELLKEVIKLKLIFISFGLYNLEESEVNDLINFCILNGIHIVFLERNKPTFDVKSIDYVYIENESFLMN